MIQEIRIAILLRVVLIVGLIGSFWYSLGETFYFTALFVFLILIVVLINLVYYLNQTNRDLAHFFDSIMHEDFSTTGAISSRGSTFKALQDRFRQVNQKFRELSAEKEANHQFLQAIVEHVEVGLLCIDSQSKVILMNRALQQMLRKSHLPTFEKLAAIDSNLYQSMLSLQPNDRQLVRLNRKDTILQLAIQRVDIKLQNKALQLFSFQNIRSELEANEVLAWQKLIRILTHEIMNSVAPIASLSSTLLDILNKPDTALAPSKEKFTQSIGVIQRRSEGLLQFTDTYRRLTRMPQPQFQQVDAQEFANEVKTLFEAELEKTGIKFELSLPNSPISFTADPNLLAQVLINIIRNAIAAVEGQKQPHILLSVRKVGSQKVQIEVKDNGVGISETQLEQVFIPFYTTKAEGTGIGLSISRQIMQLHKGSINIESEEGKGTFVRLFL